MPLNTAKKSVQLLAAISIFASGLGISKAWAASANNVRIAVLDDGAKHEKEVVHELSKLISDCNTCQIKTYSIYDKTGQLSEKTFITALEKAATESDIIHLSWNIESSEQTKKIEEALQVAAEKVLILGAAGAPQGGPDLQKPLSITVLGKIKNILIIAEENPRSKKIHMNSYMGPEIFAVVSPVKGKTGSSFSLPKVTASVAKEMAKKKQSSQQLKNYLKTIYR